jgi:hypothetical protein
MPGRLAYALEREPDYFAFARLQGGEPHAVIAVDAESDRAVGLGAGVVDARVVGGRSQRVLYGAEGMVVPERRGQGVLRALAAAARERARELQPDLSYGLALGTSGPMHDALSRGLGGVRGRPITTIRNHVFLLGARVDAAPAGFSFRPASRADAGEMSALWKRVHAARDLAPPLDDPERLLGRLTDPSGPRLGEFVLVHRGGRLRAFGVAWDRARVRQVRVHAVRGSLRAMRALYNPAAALLGRPRMPRDGEVLRSLYLGYVCAEAPEDLRALVDRVREENRASGHLYLYVALDLRDPLVPALERGVTSHADHRLMSIGWDGAEPGAIDKPAYLDIGLA